MHIQFLSRTRYKLTMIWAVLLSLLIVGLAATLARGLYNMTAALTDKPDLAVYILLPELEITDATLLRDHNGERDYLAETKDGPTLVRLRKGEDQWYVVLEERLHQ